MPNLNKSLDHAFQSGFDFVSVPIMHPRLEREFIEGPAKDRDGAVTRSDLLLPSNDWSSLVVAKVCHCILLVERFYCDIPTSPNYCYLII